MQCRRCGIEINTRNCEIDGSVVCHSCGTVYKLDAATVNDRRPTCYRNGTRDYKKHKTSKRTRELARRPGNSPRKPTAKKHGGKIGATMLILLILIFAGFGIWLLLSNKLIGRKNNEGSYEIVTSSDGRIVSLYTSSADHIVRDDDTGNSYLDNELIVSFNSQVDTGVVAEAVKAFGGTVVGVNDYLYSYQILLDRGYTRNELNGISDELTRELPSAEVMPNYWLEIDLASYPDDERWSGKWRSSQKLTWGAEAIRAPEMWEYCQSVERHPVRLGVLDNQFFTEHEDLNFQGTWLNNFDRGLDNPDHGTHVAGIAAATYGNSKGVAGIAAKEEKTPIDLYGASVQGLANNEHTDSFGVSVHVYEAGLAYLIGVKKCKVVNISLGGLKDMDGAAEVAAHIEKMLQVLVNDGFDFLLVKAAGNDRMKYDTYDLFSLFHNQLILDRVITVGATKQNDDGAIFLWENSNCGEAVDLVSPGNDIYSTTVSARWLFWIESDYGYKSGTSMAAPHVSGTAAAIWSAFPNLTGPQMKQILCESASGVYYYEEGLPYHYPMLDAYAAIQLAAKYSGQTIPSNLNPINETPGEENKNERNENSVNLNSEWKETYRQFVMNQEYVGYQFYAAASSKPSDAFYPEESEWYPVRFGLYDLNRDGIPELIAYNGASFLAGAFDNVFAFRDSQILHVGTIGKRGCELYYFDSENYPGLFDTDGNNGMYETIYYILHGNQTVAESVLTYDRTNGAWDRDTDSWSGDEKIIRQTADDNLYQLELLGEKHEFRQFSLAEIRAMGWETFVNYYFASDKSTLSSAAYDFTTVELNADQQYAVNVFLSNFAEQGIFNDFKINSIDVDQLVDFAFLYCKINRRNESIGSSQSTNSMTGDIQYYYTISLERVNETLNRHFGIQLDERSAATFPVDGNLQEHYENGTFYFPAADGAAYNRIAVVKKVYPMSIGAYCVSFNVYSLDINEYRMSGIDWSYYSMTATSAEISNKLTFEESGIAIIKPYNNSGKETFQLLEYLAH